MKPLGFPFKWKFIASLSVKTRRIFDPLRWKNTAINTKSGLAWHRTKHANCFVYF